MGELSPGAPQSARAPDDRLDSWKEIAAYLNRDVTTVQRWEKREGMPVHRHLHDRIGSVYASRAELDAWASSRNIKAPQEEDLLPTASPVPPETAPVSTTSRKWKPVLLWILAGVVLALGTIVWVQKKEVFWRNPIANARFQTLTDFEGVEQSAAISRDGQFVAFLSDHDGPMDVWVMQIGSGQFHNLTHGHAPELVNPAVRMLGFSPDGSVVTFWVRKPGGSSSDISIWAVPTLGGDPRPYLEGVAEFDWSPDGSRLAYHTPGPGDPLFVTDGTRGPQDRPIFTAPAGLHSHFHTWAPDMRSIYFVQGTLPDKLDIWRISPGGGAPERITMHHSRVTYPVFLDRRTLLYLASDPDGSGPWLYSMDVEHRIPHRLTSGLDRYTSLAASADGRRLVATLTREKSTLWRLPLGPGAPEASALPVPSTAVGASSPRLGPGFLLYVSRNSAGESIWKLADEKNSQLWKGSDAQIIAGPSVSRDGKRIAFSARQRGRTNLYSMGADGSDARVVADTLDLKGAPAWAPDGQSILIAADDHGGPHLYRVPLDGHPPAAFLQEYSVDPAWAPDGSFAVYSGPDIGTTFTVKAATAEGRAYPLKALTLTRGARHLAFLPGGHSLVFLHGEIQHKNLWVLDLDTGAERPLTNLAAGFNVSDFDISPDGHDVVFERSQEHSDVVLLEVPRP